MPPALRQRPEDIPTLAHAFLRAGGVPMQDIRGPALDRLMAYGWPGNVRELRNVITRAVALSARGARFDEMPLYLRASKPVDREPLARADVSFNEAKEAVVARFEHDYLSDLLRRSGDNLSQAARLAGLERKHLYKVLARAGLLPDRGKLDDEGGGSGA